MKKAFLGLLAATALFSACKKDEVVAPAPTPSIPAGSKGYIRITIDEKAIEARDTIETSVLGSSTFFPMLNIFQSKANNEHSELFDKTVSFNSICGGRYYNGKLKIVISATSFADENGSAVDTFVTGNNSSKAYLIEDFTEEQKKTYTINQNSKIIVTKSDDQVIEGTLKLTVKDEGGSDHDATGEFTIYKQ